MKQQNILKMNKVDNFDILKKNGEMGVTSLGGAFSFSYWISLRRTRRMWPSKVDLRISVM